MKKEERLYGCGCKKGTTNTTPASTTNTNTNITPTVQSITTPTIVKSK